MTVQPEAAAAALCTAVSQAAAGAAMRRRVRHSSCMLACVLMAVFVATDATTGTLRQSVSATAGTSTAGTSTAGTSTAGTSTAGTSSAEASSSLRDAVALPVPHATDEHVRGRALAATPVAPTTTQLVARYTRYSEGEASAAKLAPSGVGVGAGDARRGRGLHHRNTLRHMRFAAAHAGGGQLQQLDARGTTAGPFSMLSKLMGRFRKSRKPAAKACPGKPACSGHGSCDSNTGKCSCFTNWAGPMCKDDPLSASFITVDCTNMTTALTDACTRETGVGGAFVALLLRQRCACALFANSSLRVVVLCAFRVV